MADYSVTLYAAEGIYTESLYLWPAGGSYPVNTEIFIDCAPMPGFVFSHWQVYREGTQVAVIPTKNYNFLMPAGDLVFIARAVPAYKHAYIGAAKYEAYINDGTGWARYEPYINDGRGWKPMQD